MTLQQQTLVKPFDIKYYNTGNNKHPINACLEEEKGKRTLSRHKGTNIGNVVVNYP